MAENLFRSLIIPSFILNLHSSFLEICQGQMLIINYIKILIMTLAGHGERAIVSTDYIAQI